METITQKCLTCNKEFSTAAKYVKRGKGKYCSRECFHIAIAIHNRKHHKPNLQCSLCGKAFYRNASKLKNSKSGAYFCSRLCKDMAARVENNIPAIWPEHYNTSFRPNGKRTSAIYRRIAFANLNPICNQCGFTETSILQVHHKDRNKNNNSLDNLEILCPNCHALKHIK